MTFLPIVARELRVASRRRSTYWVRTGAALALLAFATWFFLMMQRDSPQQMAEGLFILLTGAATLYALLSGIRSTADCLSGERREGTLGLLFLTDLKGYDVVLGKLAANSINAFYGLLAIVPMLAIPLLMGGVTPGEFWRMALVAVNTLFFSLALGLFASAISHSARSAMGLTFLWILLFAALLPLVAWWLDIRGSTPSQELIFLLPSAGFTYGRAFDMFYKTAPLTYWWSLGVVHGLAWLSLALACFIVPRTWQDKPAGVTKLRWRERWRLWSYGNVLARVAFRQRLLGENAFFWLAARARLKPTLVWVTLGVAACVWVWGLVKYRNDWLNEGVYIITGLLLCLLLKGWVASEAGRQFAEDRTQGALELLLSTPLTVKDIVYGQFLALKRQFFGPLLVVLGVLVIMMFATGEDLQAEEDRRFWVHLWGAGMVMLVADLAALYWVGMWQGLTSRNPNRAASATLARILVLPWIAFALVVLLISLRAIRGQAEPRPELLLRWWFGLGLAADIFFGVWARHRLLSDFRLVAERRFTVRSGLWGWMRPRAESDHPQ